ncbi:quinolinate synthase NadA [Limisalsivibrio acetivorans]|uniref:quinolinate synthase NadA n=1 Tax=Limisalsivibrio acetivorans TaxID=1304888 RepID=UPI0003B5587E|nr:quinolinate synthase NadA [Limisalsivibrio acetivorans]
MDYAKEIRRLAEENDAVILAHNYQLPEIQDVADIVGDSLGLSIDAAETEKSMIVFCGVHFMAETAYMLSPDKTILLPVADAGCPMADEISGEQLREFKAEHPGATVVCYVNSTAAVKAESDIACTSGNALNVIKSIDNDRILFVPDRNLGHYVSRFTDKEIICWDGCCPVHDKAVVSGVKELKAKYPDALVVAHPECPPDTIDIADHVCSTSGIFDYCRNSDATSFIIATEEGVGYRLRKESPDKEFFFAYDNFVCEDMKKTTIKDLYNALLHKKNVITVDKEVSEKGRRCIERMLEVPRSE